MDHILINYSVKEGYAAYNETLIKDFMQQIKDYPVQGISHSVYKIGTASFIHLCHYASARSCEEAASLPAFKQFLKNLEAVVDQEPIVNDIEELGHF